MKEEKKIENKQKSLKTAKIQMNNPKSEKKEKLKNMQKKKEISEKITKSVLVNNFVKAKPPKTKQNQLHNKRSKSSDLKSTSSIKRTNMEEDNEELMYNLRSTSSDKMDRHIIRIDPNIIKIKEDNKKSGNNKKSKRERTLEYNKKQMLENKDKFKKQSSNKNSYPKETSKDSDYEDRPKRTPMNNFITSEKNQISNISEKNSNSNPVVKSNNFFLKKESVKKKTKPERIYDINQNRLKLIESNNVLAIIDAEKKNEKEKNKELGKIQHKITYLTKYNRIDVLSQALANHLDEGEANEVIMENIDQISGENNEEYGNEQFEMESKNASVKHDEQEVLSDSMDQEPIVVYDKNLINASNQTKIFKSNNLKSSSIRSKSTSSIKVRKPKVDTFDYMRKITGNNNIGVKNEESNTFRKSFSGSKKNNSKSIKSNSQDQLNEVKVDHKTTHFLENNNFILSYKEKRTEEQSQQLQRIIMYQKEKRTMENLRQKEEEEEKNRKILANLIKLNMDTRSKSMSRLTNKLGTNNSSSNLIQGKNGKKYVRNRSSPKISNNNNQDDSSYLDNDVYLQQIREFINNDLPKEKQFVPDYMRKKNSAKNINNPNKLTNENKASSKNTSIDNFDKSDHKVNNNTQFKDLKAITELSEKNPKMTENTPKNYIISPKDNFHGFGFNYGVNSIITPNSEEIDKKMNFFESGDNHKPKIQTLKSLDSEFLSINDKNFTEFSNNFNKDNKQIDEKAKLTELKQKLNTYKEKFKNIENVNGNLVENQKISNIANESFPQNNIDLIEMKNSKLSKKKSENNSISFKQNLNVQTGGENSQVNKAKKAKEEEANINRRIMEITMNNAAIRLQNLFRYIKYYREHYNEFQDQEESNQGNSDNYMESESKIMTENNSENGYKLSDPNEQYSVSVNNKNQYEEDEEEIDKSERQMNSDRNHYNERINNSYKAKSIKNQLDESNMEKSQKEVSNRGMQQYSIVHSAKSSPYSNKDFVDECNINSERNLNDSNRQIPEKSIDTSRVKSISDRKGNDNSYQGTPKKRPFNNNNQIKDSPTEKSIKNNESPGMSVNNSSFRSDYSRKCYSVQQNRNNSTIILSPNSFEAPHLHNIIALKDLIQRQRQEKSMSHESSENQPNYSHSVKSQEYIEYNNIEDNEMSNLNELGNSISDSKNDISVTSNKSAGSRLNLKQKPGAPKLNLLDLGKKNKSSRSEKSISSEQINVSCQSFDKNFDIINYENSLKKNSETNSNKINGNNNIFKNKTKPKEVQSNNNVVGSRDPIDLSKNKNHLISSQESNGSRKDGIMDHNNLSGHSENPKKNALLSSRESKIDNDDEAEGLSHKSSSKISGKVFHGKKEISPKEVEYVNQPSNENNEELSNKSNQNNSYTLKNKRSKNLNDEVEINSVNSQEPNQISLKKNDDKMIINSDVKEHLKLNIPLPNREESKSVNEGKSSSKNINNPDNNQDRDELQKSGISNKQMTVQELSNISGRHKQDSSKSDINSEFDIDAEKDANNNLIDWQISLHTEKTIERENNNTLSNRSDKYNFFFQTKTEEKADEDYKDIGKHTKEIKDNHSANHNNSYNDFIDDDNLGNIVDIDDNSNLDDMLKDKPDEDAKRFNTSFDDKQDKINEINSEREDLFKKANFNDKINLNNLLDDVKSNSELNTLSPHLFEKEKTNTVINARYKDLTDSDRKSNDKNVSDIIVDKKETRVPSLNKEELKLVDDMTELLMNLIVKQEFENLIPKKRNNNGQNNSNVSSLNNSQISASGNNGETSRGNLF